MKGRPPNKYFFHNGTKYVLTGNERLAMSHFHEVRTHLGLLKMTNVHDLPIVFGAKEFDDGTVAKFQLIHGIEEINIFAPTPVIEMVEEPEIITEEMEDMIPCFIVTGDDKYSDEIQGYIACLSGSFNGPYQYFPVPESDGTAVLEAFYHETYMEYIADLAFENNRVLSEDITKEGDGVLKYVKPSGIAVESERVTEGDDYGSGYSPTETMGPLETVMLSDDTWIWANQAYTNPRGGGGTYGNQLLFDGLYLADALKETASYSGSWYVVFDSIAITYTAEDLLDATDTVQETMDQWLIDYPYAPDEHGPLTTSSYDHSNYFYGVQEKLLDSFTNAAIRMNDTIDDSAYLLVVNSRDDHINSWCHRPVPSPYFNEFGDACAGYNGSTEDINKLYELYISADTIRYNVTPVFDISPCYKYKGIGYGANLVYHKPENSSTSTSLAVALAGLYGGDYTSAACVYVGPRANDLDGSVSFPVIADGLDRYFIVPNVSGIPQSIEGKVRGHVFLGRIKTSREIKIR